VYPDICAHLILYVYLFNLNYVCPLLPLQHADPAWPPLAVDYLLIVWEHRSRSNAKDLGWYPTPIISYCSGLEGDKPVGWDISGWSDQFGSGLVLLPVHNALPNK
jgi:hypothetical protein